MTNSLDHDLRQPVQPQNPLLPFPAEDLDRSGLRLTRAEFARFLGTSKQTVGEWVKAGKIILGADGRLDPRQAVSQLLRNSDPVRLRAKVLAPLLSEASAMRKRLSTLESGLAAAEEEARFHEEAASGALEALHLFKARLVVDWKDLQKIDSLDDLRELLDAMSEDALRGDLGFVDPGFVDPRLPSSEELDSMLAELDGGLIAPHSNQGGGGVVTDCSIGGNPDD